VSKLPPFLASTIHPVASNTLIDEKESRCRSRVAALDGIIRAGEYTLDIASLVVKNDAVDRGISTHAEKVEPDDNDEDIHQESNPATDAPLLVEARAKIRPAHAKVGDTPEDPAEERVEETAHERQEVGEEGNDFCDDESDDPSRGEDGCPCSPAQDRVRGLVSAAFEDAEEDKTRRYGRVEDAEEDQCWNHDLNQDGPFATRGWKPQSKADSLKVNDILTKTSRALVDQALELRSQDNVTVMSIKL